MRPAVRYQINQCYLSHVAQWLSVQTHNAGVITSIPPCVTFQTPLVRKATGNHLMNSTSLERTQSPVSGFCYARNRVWSNCWRPSRLIIKRSRNQRQVQGRRENLLLGGGGRRTSDFFFFFFLVGYVEERSW